MPFAAYLFDLDGTLIDSTELILASFHHTRRVHFGDRLPDVRWIETFGTPLRTVFGSMARSPEHAREMVSTYVDFNLTHHDDMVRPFPGVHAALEKLRSRGARLAVVTSKITQHARRGLSSTGLKDFFQCVIGADEVRDGKPAPEPILVALGRVGCAARDAVMVGDSPHDIEAARAAGAAAAAVGWGPFDEATLRRSRPDIWLDRAEGLLDL